jgi:glycosyltransferase involved in cell wall biosynthesis
MKLAIDLQSCQTDSRERGIGRYALGLAAALHDLRAEDFEVSLLLDAVRGDRLAEARRRLRALNVDAPTHCYTYPSHSGFTEARAPLAVGAGLLKSKLVEATGVDALLVSSFFEVGDRFASGYALEAMARTPKAVIAYDLIPLLFPERYLPQGQFIEAWYRERLQAFRQFDLYLAISQSTKQDLVTHLSIDPDRIAVIDAGIDPVFLAGAGAALTPAELSALGISQPFVLMVGNADWRKNCLGALEIYARLPEGVRRTHQLVFTRVGDDVHQALNGRLSHLRESVVILGTVQEQTLVSLYASCKVFFFPSLYEGFGLPVLEAMAAGAAVLSASRGALSEVVHRADCLFDPEDQEQAASLLRKALAEEDFRAGLLSGAREHAASYTWERSARLAKSALQELGAHQSPRVVGPSAWMPTEAEIGVLADALAANDADSEIDLLQVLEAIARHGRRRVLVDITEVVRLDARSGIQRVVRNYCAGLARLAQATRQFDLVPIVWRDGRIVSAFDYLRSQLSVDVDGIDREINVQIGDLALMLDSSWWSPERFSDLHVRVRAAGGEVVWMVYDLVPILTPQFCDPVMPPVFRTWLDHVAATADGCVCISKSTQEDLRRYFAEQLGPHRALPWTRYIHLGSDFDAGTADLPSPSARALVECLEAKGYCVTLSTIEPRKDYVTILNAFERLWASGSALSLVIIGKQGWNVDALCQRLRSHPELGKRLHWLDRASDGDVRSLLAGARCLIQASYAEGFGLAVVEAGSLGVPLVLSDIPVFFEVAGSEAEYFEAGNAAGLAAVLAANEAAGAWRRPLGLRTLSWGESSKRLAAILVGERAVAASAETRA